MTPQSATASMSTKRSSECYDLPSTKEVVRFLYAALGFPTKATLLTAAHNGNLVTFPGLTPNNINKHFPESEETQKGHMRQERQGVCSTKAPDKDAVLEKKPKPGVKHKDVYLFMSLMQHGKRCTQTNPALSPGNLDGTTNIS